MFSFKLRGAGKDYTVLKMQDGELELYLVFEHEIPMGAISVSKC